MVPSPSVLDSDYGRLRNMKQVDRLQTEYLR